LCGCPGRDARERASVYILAKKEDTQSSMKGTEKQTSAKGIEGTIGTLKAEIEKLQGTVDKYDKGLRGKKKEVKRAPRKKKKDDVLKASVAAKHARVLEKHERAVKKEEELHKKAEEARAAAEAPKEQEPAAPEPAAEEAPAKSEPES